MRTEEIDGKQIQSDGWVVWVNAPTCIGRFCKVSYEVVDSDKNFSTCKGSSTKGTTTLKDWELFKQKMQEIHGVTVPDDHKPNYLRKEKQP